MVVFDIQDLHYITSDFSSSALLLSKVSLDLTTKFQLHGLEARAQFCRENQWFCGSSLKTRFCVYSLEKRLDGLKSEMFLWERGSAEPPCVCSTNCWTLYILILQKTIR